MRVWTCAFSPPAREIIWIFSIFLAFLFPCGNKLLPPVVFINGMSMPEKNIRLIRDQSTYHGWASGYYEKGRHSASLFFLMAIRSFSFVPLDQKGSCHEQRFA